jgi:hypothetical protein
LMINLIKIACNFLELSVIFNPQNLWENLLWQGRIAGTSDILHPNCNGLLMKDLVRSPWVHSGMGCILQCPFWGF